MSRKIINVAIVAVIILSLVGAFWAINYYENLPQNLTQHETIVIGQSSFVPGSQAALRVVVRDRNNDQPLSNAEISVSMKPQEGGEEVLLYEGTTDESGTAGVAFTVPEEAAVNQNLIVRTHSDLGSDTLEKAVTIERDVRIFLTTDKPIYQPGQEIHLRALVLSSFDLKPIAGENVELIIADGSGNKLFRETLVSSEYGVISSDFQLAPEAGSGNYKITAQYQDVSSEKTVRVEHYVLPKFDVNLNTDKAYYKPGDTVSGTLQADYFFGKPVDESAVLIEGYTFDFEKVVTFSFEGTTDENGSMEFELTLPDYIAGSDLEGGMGRYYLTASVTDQANQVEDANLSLPVSSSTLVIEAIPEGGQFRMGVENILYVLTSYPDGTPAQTKLVIHFYENDEEITVETGEYGIAAVDWAPEYNWVSFYITAQDEMGNEAYMDYYFEGNYFEEGVLLRPEFPVYQVGDTMNLTVLTSQQSGTVYLDIVRDGQTISTRSVDISAGEGQAAVDLTPDLYGTLELHAYKILSSGSIVRDTRMVVVDQANDLLINMSLDQDIYLPGDSASLDIQVNGQQQEGVQSALGLAVVDESVFALAEQDPGFARLYFMLEAEILTPRYELHNYGIPELVSGVEVNEEIAGAVNEAAQASLAAAVTQSGFSLVANSYEENVRIAYDAQEEFYLNFTKILFGVLIVIGLSLTVITILNVVREKMLGKSLMLAFGIFIGLIVFLMIVPSPEYGWYDGLFGNLLGWLEFLSDAGEWLLYFWFFFSLIGFIALLVIGIRKKDSGLLWTLGLLILFLINILLLGLALNETWIDPDTWVLILALIIFALVPISLLVRFSGYLFQNRAIAAVAMLPLTLLFLIGSIPLMGGGISMNSNLARDLGGVVVMEEVEMDADFAMEEEAVMAPQAADGKDTVNEGMVMDEAEETTTEEASSSASQAPRLRQYFPETMLWLPDEITDENGYLNVEIPVADSITTWRMTALASSQDGRLGSISAPMLVFQDFFIDIDLPVSLTVGDEIAVPVAVYNYLTEEQDVSLELEQEDWFELLDEPVKEMTIGANDISVVYFRIKALDFGWKPFQVTALGSKMSDAILKQVHVYPDGKKITFNESDRLSPEEDVSQTIMVPAETIGGTQQLQVKIYPGVVSQIVEGLDALLRMPYGCFEQTSSTTYPNILVMDYLKTTDQISPEVEMKAEEYINLGYQRLVTFEVNNSGGFSLFGDAPADPMLTAYGLQEFYDMSRVYNIDMAIIDRIVNWLINNQNSDGSWQGVEGFHESGLTGQVGKLPVTAYVVWGMADAGYQDNTSTLSGVNFLKENQQETNDPYELALIANALVSYDIASGTELSSMTQNVLNRLAEMAQTDGSSSWWDAGDKTVMGGYGESGALETTALAALAFLKADVNPDLANAALTYLIKGKDSFGTWQTTQATVMSLKAFMESVRVGAEDMNATVSITLNNGQTREVEVTPETFDVVQVVSFDDINIGRDNIVDIHMEGEGSLMYQVTGSYYLPWDVLADYPELVQVNDMVAIDVQYDRTELAVNDLVNVTVKVTLAGEGSTADQAIIDLGIPPGFSLEADDLSALVTYYNDVPEDYAFPIFQKYEMTGRQLIVYLNNLSAENPVSFTYQLRAKYPLRVQDPGSQAYDYYNPMVSGQEAPQTLTVTE